MPVTAKTYPEWVQKYRTQGRTVKRKGDCYYLYKRTSKRVEGKKYPQPVDTYIGKITPDGIEYAKSTIVPKSEEVIVREYGFTEAVLACCPEGWKKVVGRNWKEILKVIIVKKSPNSYLIDDPSLRKEEEFNVNFSTQIQTLGRRMKDEHGHSLEDLEPLKYVYLVQTPASGRKLLSRINEDQRRLLDELGCELEVR